MAPPKATLAIRLSVTLGTLAALGTIAAPKANAALLVGNSDSSDIVQFDEQSGQYGGEFIPAISGLSAPDDITFGPDGNLYISYASSKDDRSGSILRFDGKTGSLLGRFDQGGTLKRPYGLAFGPDGNLYVSSFRSDQILRYNGQTGAFIDVFAFGNGQANGLNGPDDLLFDSKGNLYVTTQGSVADPSGEVSFLFDSQVLRYSLSQPNQPSVFVPQPTPLPGVGFVSFLGLALDPGGNLFVSDFANNIRRYDLASGKLLDTLDTNYTGTSPSSNYLGNLTFDASNNLYAPAFDFTTPNNTGVILRYDGATGKPLPAAGQSSAIFVPPNPNLQRPIGIAYKPSEVPEPSTILGSLVGLGMLASLVRLRRASRSQQSQHKL